MDLKNPSLFSLNFPATCDVTFLLLFQTTGPAAYPLLPTFSTFRTNFTCNFASFNSRQIVIRRWKANEKTNLRGKNIKNHTATAQEIVSYVRTIIMRFIGL